MGPELGECRIGVSLSRGLVGWKSFTMAEIGLARTISLVYTSPQSVSNDDSSAGRFTGTCPGRIGSKGLGFWVGRVRVRVQNGRIGGLGYVVSRKASIPAAGYAFAEPSVTAGEVEKYGKQLTEQEAVVEYLQSEGIDTADLEGLELPPSTEVIRERLQFLLKIGLVVQDINDYPLLLGCSVKKNLIPVLDYLESLGVTTSSLPILVRKYPQILHSSVVVDLQPIVQYLEGLGIQREDMGSVLTRYPDVFGFKIEGTMSTSTAYLVMIGVNPRKIGSIFTQMPQIMGMRVGNNLKRKVDFLQGFGIPRPAIAKMIENRPVILGLSLEDQMRPAVDSLVEIGVGMDAVGRVIMLFPDILGLDVKAKLGEKLPWLTSKIGIKQEDVGEILMKLPQVLVINVAMGSARVEYLKQAGLSHEDIASMVTKSPQLLAASIEQSLKPNLEYLVEKMKRSLEEVVEFPAFLLYSLEARISPRYEEIAAKGLECSLAWMFNCTDQVFQERLLAEYSGQSGSEAEPDVPYIVSRRSRLVDQDEVENVASDEVGEEEEDEDDWQLHKA